MRFFVCLLFDLLRFYFLTTAMSARIFNRVQHTAELTTCREQALQAQRELQSQYEAKINELDQNYRQQVSAYD